MCSRCETPNETKTFFSFNITERENLLLWHEVDITVVAETK